MASWRQVGADAMVAVATRDVRPFHVNVGIPARSVRVKPNAPPEVYRVPCPGTAAPPAVVPVERETAQGALRAPAAAPRVAEPSRPRRSTVGAV